MSEFVGVCVYDKVPDAPQVDVEVPDLPFVFPPDLPCNGAECSVVQYEPLNASGKKTRLGQDYVYVAEGLVDENGERIDVMFVFDGHGRDDVINLIRQMSLSEIARLKNPFMEIRNRIRENNPSGQNHVRSGATFTMVRIYKNRVVINYCGDSPAMVYINGSLVFQTIPHSVSVNEAEVARVKKLGMRINKGAQIEVVSDDIITMRSSNLVEYRNGDQCAASMSLGHNEAFGYDYVLDSDGKVQDGVLPDYVIMFEESDHVVVVAGSDGIFDMFNGKSREDHTGLIIDSAQQSCEKYVKRWEQRWVYIQNYDKTITYDISGINRLTIPNPDDVSFVKYSGYPGELL
jgi:serine/threonine protein phosphatase PrpC